jgi:cytochrome c-type biogenesis protein CcmH
MVAGLAARLEADANDLDGWLRLINAYAVLGQRDEAAAALVKARDAFAADEAALARLGELAELHQLQEN